MDPQDSRHAHSLFHTQTLAATLLAIGLPPDCTAPTSLPWEQSVLESPFDPRHAAFTNPILPAPSADPWIVQHCGIWYALMVSGRTLQLRATPLLSEIGTMEPITIWRAPQSGLLSRNIWAPELHFLNGHWYIYLTGDNGNNDNHRMWVLEAETPLGPWRNRGQLETGGWAIDATVLEDQGRLFCIWSGWPGRRNVRQNLYIAPMRNPWTISGPRTLLAEPTEAWERVALPLCEGPQVLRHGGRSFIVYSASGSWTPDYCLGMLVNDDGDFLNPRSWKKRGPVFRKTEQVWGVGHCCFAHHPSAGDLIFYHAKTKRAHGWEDRNVRVQPFGWTQDGIPDFGVPVSLA